VTPAPLVISVGKESKEETNQESWLHAVFSSAWSLGSANNK
jgi:hypothetical protein